ncbi:MAG: hypothetical protein PHF00_05555 [Elusimicrobia bacterium]|nr:hypothetical protein [Elusimicrobiota bacterium]
MGNKPRAGQARDASFRPLLRLALLAAALSTSGGCSTLRHKAPMPAPECSGGVCIFRAYADDARDFCYAMLGQPEPACWNPDIKVAVEGSPMSINPGICRMADDEATCRRELFGEDFVGGPATSAGLVSPEPAPEFPEHSLTPP